MEAQGAPVTQGEENLTVLMRKAAQVLAQQAPVRREEPKLTRVEPSLYASESFGVSGRHRRLARKWPWSWRCTAEECDDSYGAAKTEHEARQAADRHEEAVHPARVSV